MDKIKLFIGWLEHDEKTTNQKKSGGNHHITPDDGDLDDHPGTGSDDHNGEPTRHHGTGHHCVLAERNDAGLLQQYERNRAGKYQRLHLHDKTRVVKPIRGSRGLARQ